MDNILWILKRLKPALPLLLLSLVGSLLQSAGATAITLLVKSIIDDVFIFRDKERLIETIVLLLAFALVMQVGFFLSKSLVSLASERTLRDLREDIFKRLITAPYHFFIRNRSGDTIGRVVSDVDKLRQIFLEHIPVLLREPFVGLALLGVLFYRDPVLTIFLILVLPVMSISVKFFGSKKSKHMGRTQEGTGELTQILSQVMHGIENVKLFLAERRFVETFRKFNEKIYRASVKAEIYVAGNTALNYITGYVVVALVLFYGGYRIVEGHLTPGEFVSYLTALFMVQPPILNSQKALMALRGTLSVVDRVRELLSLEEELSGSIKVKGLRKEIKFVSVSVKLGESYVLRDVNLKVRRGEKLGIVGRTGSGKSTLVRLIPRLIDYSGEIYIDDIELKECELSSLRREIGFLTQEPFLLNASIRENLLIAKEGATDSELEEALKLALCDFVFKLKDGLDTIVGERGYALSGGERQRLSLARLFLRNPEIVILDEATSALDLNTEKKVLKNLFEFFEGKTMLIVAHRLSNVMECDRIIVMKEGCIAEEGDFYRLIKDRGEFFHIFREGKMV